MCRVPKEVLHEGYFLVSMEDGKGLLTNKVRVPVAPMPEEFEPDIPSGGNSGPSMVYVPEVDKDKILSWTLQEVTDDMPEIPPTDLNPADDWVEDETESEYEWEEDV